MHFCKHILLVSAGFLAGGCSTIQQPAPADAGPPAIDALQLLDRISWGASPASIREIRRVGADRYLAHQLKPGAQPALPAVVEDQIEATNTAGKTPFQLAAELDAQRRAADALANDEDKKAARQTYQQELTRIGRESMRRTLLRAVYSPHQLQEQMTWFWFNHFNVYQFKANLRALIGDYEDSAIRPRALGRFGDMLKAVVHHPAMLIYLDNVRNAAGRINENFARELMELHTLGVNGGYTQQDVQELARILTGVGVNIDPKQPRLRPALQPYYVREGLFEFNPNRHDFGDKLFLGTRVRCAGLDEVDAALDQLARHPSTALFIATKLATFFLADAPPPALIARIAGVFERSDGDIAATLAALFATPEFAASLGRKFKDPMHYVISAVRMTAEDGPVADAGLLINWLNRMGQPLHGRQTPDGYPLGGAAWASPGQMATRFEIARAIGGGGGAPVRRGQEPATGRAAAPQLENVVFDDLLQARLSAPTREALVQAGSQREWNIFLLASPEFMLH